MLKINEDEAKVIKNFLQYIDNLWAEYIKSIDIKDELDIKTKELMRMAFITGIWMHLHETFNISDVIEEGKEK